MQQPLNPAQDAGGTRSVRPCGSVDPTGMARLGFPVQVVEAVLNHASGAVSGVAAIYNRHDYAAEKRAALEAWSQHVLALVGEGAAADCKAVAVAE